MDKFIYNETKEKWEDYLINIKKILSQPNNITTNDTFLEDKKDILQLNDEIKKNKGDIEIVRAEQKNNIEIIDKKIFNLNLLVNNNKNEKNIKESRFAEIEEINEAQFEKESNNINI